MGLEQLLPELAKYGIGAIFGGVILWLWQRDQKKFEEHLKEDALRERDMKQQAENDRDRMIDVIITNNDALKDMRHAIELDQSRKGGQ